MIETADQRLEKIQSSVMYARVARYGENGLCHLCFIQYHTGERICSDVLNGGYAHVECVWKEAIEITAEVEQEKVTRHSNTQTLDEHYNALCQVIDRAMTGNMNVRVAGGAQSSVAETLRPIDITDTRALVRLDHKFIKKWARNSYDRTALTLALNIHELGHMWHTPTNFLSSRKATKPQKNAWQILEDQRQEIATILMYPRAVDYLRFLNARGLALSMAFDSSNMGRNFLVQYGRRHLYPPSVNQKLEDLATQKYGQANVDTIKAIIDEFLRLRLPGEEWRAWTLVTRLAEIDQIFDMESPEIMHGDPRHDCAERTGEPMLTKKQRDQIREKIMKLVKRPTKTLEPPKPKPKEKPKDVLEPARDDDRSVSPQQDQDDQPSDNATAGESKPRDQGTGELGDDSINEPGAEESEGEEKPQESDLGDFADKNFNDLDETQLDDEAEGGDGEGTPETPSGDSGDQEAPSAAGDDAEPKDSGGENPSNQQGDSQQGEGETPAGETSSSGTPSGSNGERSDSSDADDEVDLEVVSQSGGLGEGGSYEPPDLKLSETLENLQSAALDQVEEEITQTHAAVKDILITPDLGGKDRAPIDPALRDFARRLSRGFENINQDLKAETHRAQRKGKLDARRLPLMITAANPRIFKRKLKDLSPDAALAVHIMVDVSSSMLDPADPLYDYRDRSRHPNKIDIALPAAFILARAIEYAGHLAKVTTWSSGAVGLEVQKNWLDEQYRVHRRLPYGGTDPTIALARAIPDFTYLEQETEIHNHVIILITDGEINKDAEAEVESLLGQHIKRGVHVIEIGVGVEPPQIKGTWKIVQIPSVQEIHKALAKPLAELAIEIAKGVRRKVA
jgi:hypothetical protein